MTLGRFPRTNGLSAGFATRAVPVILVASGCLALALGMLVYAADRQPSHAALSPVLTLATNAALFGAFGHWLPSFVHPFAFSLFTAAALSTARPAYWACLAWWAVNVAFEVAQAPGASVAVARVVHDALGQTWFARPISNYVLRGTFDVRDLMAATAGAIAAACVLCLVHHLGVRNEQQGIPTV